MLVIQEIAVGMIRELRRTIAEIEKADRDSPHPTVWQGLDEAQSSTTGPSPVQLGPFLVRDDSHSTQR